MGTRGYIVHRFRSRYYVHYNHLDSYYEQLGKSVVASIPSGKEEYKRWCTKRFSRMVGNYPRAYYTAKENEEDSQIFVTRHENKESETSMRYHGDEWPTCVLLEPDDLFIEYCYIINLDQEVLTMQYGIHWDLQNIPRENDQWLSDIRKSLYRYKMTICPDICPSEYMKSPALPLRGEEWEPTWGTNIVSARKCIDTAAKPFLAYAAGSIFHHYRVEMMRFGREWEVTSLPFREFVFAFVFIASGQARFLDVHAASSDLGFCSSYFCDCQRSQNLRPWFDTDHVGELALLPVFGSLHHTRENHAGASPEENTYWYQGVLVHLSLVVDGNALEEAVERGVIDGNHHFQFMVISVLQVALGEVSQDTAGNRTVKTTKALYLSPLRHKDCLSTHPLERPVRPEDSPGIMLEGDQVLRSNCFGSRERLEKFYPRLCALVNFFDVAQRRSATAKILHVLPMEMFNRIVSFVDYDTWRACLKAHHRFRSACLTNFRIDDDWAIVSRPAARKHTYLEGQPASLHRHLLSFHVKDCYGNKIYSVTQSFSRRGKFSHRWVPLIGEKRKVLMINVNMHFEITDDKPLEDGDSTVGLYPPNGY